MTTQNFKKENGDAKVIYTASVEINPAVYGVVNIYDCSFIEKTWIDNFDDRRFSEFSKSVCEEYFANAN